jgi:hypothetical protein
MEIIQNEITKGFDDAKAAASALGITLKSDLDSSLQSAFDNYSKLVQLQKTGIVTQRDVDAGYKALIKSELAYATSTGATGQAVAKLKEQLKELLVAELAQARAAHAGVQDLQAIQRQIDLLDGKLNKSKGVARDYANQLREDLANGASAWVQFQDVADIAMYGIVSSMESAFAALVSGQESFGQAMEKAVGGLIAAIAEHYAEYYAAKGIATIWENPGEGAADLAAAAALFAIAGAASALGSGGGGGGSSSRGSGSSGSGTSGPAANSPNINSQPAPSQVVNITHMTDALQTVARMSPTLPIPSSMIFPQPVSSSSTGSVSGMVSKQDIQELTKALKQNPGMSHVSVTIEGDLPMLVTKINHGTKTGRLRLHSTSTDKTIRKA